MNMKTWNDITLAQFKQIQEVLSTHDDYMMFNLLDIIYGVDSANMTINEIKQYKDALNFLSQPIERCTVLTKYTLNGHEYKSNFDLTMVTTAQFIDYQSYIKKEEKRYEELLSVFFIPVGHKYNDGYDIREVQTDLLQLDIATVQSIAFFMTEQLETFWILFRHYLTENLKKMKLPKQKMKQIEEQLDKADFSNLGSYLTFLNTAKKQ